jgi:aspartate 1-decarboxylase
MTIEVLKSKIHRVTVTGAELDYIGSITIDRTLMDAANIVAGEKVQVVNVNNGERSCCPQGSKRRYHHYHQLCQYEC